jgi:hypothetical protein
LGETNLTKKLLDKMMDKPHYGILSLPVIVGALGFFVDVYDLLLFNIIRKPSLQDLGLSGDDILTSGENILSIQMIGILLGGIVWGILPKEKRGIAASIIATTGVMGTITAYFVSHGFMTGGFVIISAGHWALYCCCFV